MIPVSVTSARTAGGPPASRAAIAGGFAATMERVSAPAGTGGGDDDAIGAGYDDWTARRRRDGVDEAVLARDGRNRAPFLAIARRAEGMADARAFVAGLGTGELETLRQVHGLGAAIDPAALSEEGARNLLVPRTLSVDLDGDGMTEIGIGRTLVFPPNDAPQAVKDAWDAATKDMDFAGRLHLQMTMAMSRNREDGSVAGLADLADYRALADVAVAGGRFNLRHQTAATAAFAARHLNDLIALRDRLARA